MSRSQIALSSVPVVLALFLLGTYLYSVPLAVQRANRSPCPLLGIGQVRPPVAPGSIVVKDLEGKPFPLRQLRGRLVLLNFWLTTCDPCLEELPSLLEVSDRLGGQGLTLLMVSTDKDVEAIKAFIRRVPRLRRLPDNALILHDPAGKLARKLGTEKYPETYLITPGLSWGGRVMGARSWTQQGVLSCLKMKLP